MVERAEASVEQAEKARDAIEDEARTIKAELRELRSDLERREARLSDREQRLDDEERKLEDRAAGLDESRDELDKRRAELDRFEAQRREALERVAGLTADQAKAELVSSIGNQAKREAALTVRDIERQARADGEAAGQEDCDAGDPAGRHRTDHRVGRVRPASAERRDEGPHHRP